MRYIILYFTGLMMLTFSTLAAWYEGSELRERPSEWVYSAPFSKLLHETVISESHISGLDHFVYAAKFKPAFPFLMIISIFFLITFATYHTAKKGNRKMTIPCALSGLILLSLSWLISASPTPGLKLFETLFLYTGMVSFLVSIVLLFRGKDRKRGNYQT